MFDFSDILKYRLKHNCSFENMFSFEKNDICGFFLNIQTFFKISLCGQFCSALQKNSHFYFVAEKILECKEVQLHLLEMLMKKQTQKTVSLKTHLP